MTRWKATVHVGVFWVGPTYLLCIGPRWWVHLRSKLHLIKWPYRRIHVEPMT